MATTIDERVVEMKFDNSNFEQNTKTTMSTLDKLKAALRFDGVSEGFDKISNAASSIKMDGLGTACETVQAKFSALQVVAFNVLSKITSDAYDAGKKIVSALSIEGAKDGFQEYELKMGSVQTIMNGTGESLETVMAQLEELNKYADRTIYSFSDMTANIGKFTNAGVKLEDAVAAIKGVSNEAAVSGANANEASRAMYNFAQALSAGYVKLIDWKSIENANMATVEFKNELIKTALEVGTLTKKEDKFITTTTNAKGQISEAFDATSMFNESLNHEWMTTDVLTKTLAKYADENTDVGKKASEAATKVKTFTMMMETLEEAVGSGWAITWENIIGNFDEATEFFTDATNTLSEMIDKQAKSRNDFLKEALSPKTIGLREWQETMVAAGSYSDRYKEQIMATARQHGVAIDEMIEKEGSFEATLKSGWLTQDIFAETNREIQKLAGSSSEFRSLASAISDVNTPFGRLVLSMNEVSGRVHIINTLKNMLEALVSVMKPVKEAFNNIFPPKTADDLRNLLASIEEFSKKLILSEENANKLKTAFEGFFSVISIGKQAISAIADALSPLVDIFQILFRNIFSGSSTIAEFFKELNNDIQVEGTFTKALSGIKDSLATFASNLQGYIDDFKAKFSELTGIFKENIDTSSLEKLTKAFDGLRETLSKFTGNIYKGFKEFIRTLTEDNDVGDGATKIVTFLTKLVNGVVQLAGNILTIFEPVTEKLKAFFEDVNVLDGIGASISGGGIAAVLAWIASIFENLSDTIDAIATPEKVIGNISAIIQGLGDVLDSVEESIRTEVVFKIATSIGILAAAIIALANIDSAAAAKSIGIISALMGELIGVFKAIDMMTTKYSSNATNPFKRIAEGLSNIIGESSQIAMITALSSALVKFAAAIGILAVSLKLISSINSEDLLRSFIALSVLVYEMAGVATLLSTLGGKMTKGAGALIALATSITILSVALKILASIEFGGLVKGMIAVTVLLNELMSVIMVMSVFNSASGAASLIAVSLALLVLSGAMKVFATMSLWEIVKGLIAIGGVLIELAAGLDAMLLALPGAAALLVASAALLVLSGALKVLGTMSLADIGKSLLVVGGILLELSVALTAMMLALPGAAALLVAAGAIAILTPALIALSAVDSKSIYKAIGELAVALIAFGGVSAALSVVSPLILAFAASLTVLGVAILTIGGGLALLGTGIAALAVGIGALSEIGTESILKVKDVLIEICTALITRIPTLGTAFAQALGTFSEEIIKQTPKIKGALNSLVELLVQVFTENIPKLADSFGQLLLSLYQTAETYIPQIQEAFLNMLIGFIEVTAQKMPDIVNAAIDLMVAFIDGIASMDAALVDAGMKAIVDFINGLADSIRKNTPLLLDAVKNLFHAIIEAMVYVLVNGNTKLYNQAIELMRMFKKGISSKISEVVSEILTMIKKMIQTIGDMTEEFKQAARDFMQGFINGIKEKIEDAKNAVKGLGEAVIGKLRGSLDEHSPSKIADGIGQFFGIGFAQGITSTKRDVVKSADGLAQSVINAIKSAKDYITNNGNSEPVIRPVLDLSNIKNGVGEINKLSGEWDNMSIGMSGNIASINASAMNQSMAIQNSQNGVEMLKDVLNKLSDVDSSVNNYNTFNISGDNPQDIANEVSRALQRQLERRGAVWA